MFFHCHVANETLRDPILSRVYQSILKGWSVRVEEDRPYYERRSEPAVHQGCFLWGMRSIIPSKLQTQVLDELQDDNLGIVKMKTLATKYQTST